MPFRPPQRHAVTPGGRGRFPGFDVMDEIHRWDEVTAGVVLSRLDPPPELSFFTPAEQATADALLNDLLAQHDEPKVPVLRLIDERLALDETDGWRYDDMPDDPQAWRASLAGLDEDARRDFDRPFHALRIEDRSALIQSIQDTEGKWHGMQAGHVWSLWTRYACAAFYSHPWVWNEIGFGGPAYPRGYANLRLGGREDWEVEDQDNTDPVPWADRREQAERAHAQRLGHE